MIGAAIIIAVIYGGVLLITGAQTTLAQLAGWLMIVWAIWRYRVILEGTKRFAVLFVALTIAAIGLAVYNGRTDLLEALF